MQTIGVEDDFLLQIFIKVISWENVEIVQYKVFECTFISKDDELIK